MTKKITFHRADRSRPKRIEAGCSSTHANSSSRLFINMAEPVRRGEKHYIIDFHANALLRKCLTRPHLLSLASCNLQFVCTGGLNPWLVSRNLLLIAHLSDWFAALQFFCWDTFLIKRCLLIIFAYIVDCPPAPCGLQAVLPPAIC